MTSSSESYAPGGTYTPGHSPHLVGLIVAGPAAAIVGILFFVFANERISVVGAWSMDDRVVLSSLLVAPLAFAYGAWAAWGWKHESMPVAKTVSRGIATTVGFVSLSAIAMPIIGSAFQHYIFNSFYAAVFPAITSGAVAYACGALAARRWPGDLVALAAAVAGVAVLGAAAVSGAPEWWAAALSSLGTEESPAWQLFNLGMIVCGAVLLLAVPTMRPMLNRANKMGIASTGAPRAMSWGMAVAALCLIAVGLVPMDSGSVQFVIHDIAGVGFGAILLVGMMLSKRLFPGLPKQFIWYSWALAALALVTSPLYKLGAMSQAEIEIVIFGVEALWAMLWLASLKDAGV